MQLWCHLPSQVCILSDGSPRLAFSPLCITITDQSFLFHKLVPQNLASILLHSLFILSNPLLLSIPLPLYYSNNCKITLHYIHYITSQDLFARLVAQPLAPCWRGASTPVNNLDNPIFFSSLSFFLFMSFFFFGQPAFFLFFVFFSQKCGTTPRGCSRVQATLTHTLLVLARCWSARCLRH